MDYLYTANKHLENSPYENFQKTDNNIPENYSKLANKKINTNSSSISANENKHKEQLDIEEAKQRFYALKQKKNKRHFQVIYMFKNK